MFVDIITVLQILIVFVIVYSIKSVLDVGVEALVNTRNLDKRVTYLEGKLNIKGVNKREK